jgi:hypothetical protein
MSKKTAPKLSPRIVRALFDTVINPLVRALPEEYQLLEQHNWTWRFRPGSLELIRMIPAYVDHLTRDNLDLFVDLFPVAQKYFKDHDKGVERLVATCSKCHEVVKESERLNDTYERATRRDSLNELGVAEISGLFGAYPKENHLDLLAEQVVNGAGDLPLYYPFAHLWNKYREDFLNILAEPEVRPSYDAVLQAGQETQKTYLPLLTYLKQQRLQLSLKYGEPYAAVTAPAEVS